MALVRSGKYVSKAGVAFIPSSYKKALSREGRATISRPGLTTSGVVSRAAQRTYAGKTVSEWERETGKVPPGSAYRPGIRYFSKEEWTEIQAKASAPTPGVKTVEVAVGQTLPTGVRIDVLGQEVTSGGVRYVATKQREDLPTTTPTVSARLASLGRTVGTAVVNIVWRNPKTGIERVAPINKPPGKDYVKTTKKTADTPTITIAPREQFGEITTEVTPTTATVTSKFTQESFLAPIVPYVSPEFAPKTIQEAEKLRQERLYTKQLREAGFQDVSVKREKEDVIFTTVQTAPEGSFFEGTGTTKEKLTTPIIPPITVTETVKEKEPSNVDVTFFQTTGTGIQPTKGTRTDIVPAFGLTQTLSFEPKARLVRGPPLMKTPAELKLETELKKFTEAQTMGWSPQRQELVEEGREVGKEFRETGFGKGLEFVSETSKEQAKIAETIPILGFPAGVVAGSIGATSEFISMLPEQLYTGGKGLYQLTVEKPVMLSAPEIAGTIGLGVIGTTVALGTGVVTRPVETIVESAPMFALFGALEKPISKLTTPKKTGVELETVLFEEAGDLIQVGEKVYSFPRAGTKSGVGSGIETFTAEQAALLNILKYGGKEQPVVAATGVTVFDLKTGKAIPKALIRVKTPKDWLGRQRVLSEVPKFEEFSFVEATREVPSDLIKVKRVSEPVALPKDFGVDYPAVDLRPFKHFPASAKRVMGEAATRSFLEGREFGGHVSLEPGSRTFFVQRGSAGAIRRLSPETVSYLGFERPSGLSYGQGAFERAFSFHTHPLYGVPRKLQPTKPAGVKFIQDVFGAETPPKYLPPKLRGAFRDYWREVSAEQLAKASSTDVRGLLQRKIVESRYPKDLFATVEGELIFSPGGVTLLKPYTIPGAVLVRQRQFPSYKSAIDYLSEPRTGITAPRLKPSDLFGGRKIIREKGLMFGGGELRTGGRFLYAVGELPIGKRLGKQLTTSPFAEAFTQQARFAIESVRKDGKKITTARGEMLQLAQKTPEVRGFKEGTTLFEVPVEGEGGVTFKQLTAVQEKQVQVGLTKSRDVLLGKAMELYERGITETVEAKSIQAGAVKGLLLSDKPVQLFKQEVRGVSGLRQQPRGMSLIRQVKKTRQVVVTRTLPRTVVRQPTRQVPIDLTIPRGVVRTLPREITRQVPRDLLRELPRTMPREVPTLRLIPRQATRTVERQIPKEITREVTREITTTRTPPPPPPIILLPPGKDALTKDKKKRKKKKVKKKLFKEKFLPIASLQEKTKFEILTGEPARQAKKGVRLTAFSKSFGLRVPVGKRRRRKK